ncbi:MAG: ADP-ribosylation factor-like protein [Promethearchaeota archaeon]
MSDIEKILEFFKRGTLDNIKKITEILDLSIDTLVGISHMHAEELNKLGIKTIKDLTEVKEIPSLKDAPKNLIEKWVNLANLLTHFVKKSGNKKIIMLGLDNAGKTSILSILQRKYSIIKSLLPTRGVSRQSLRFLGTDLVCWEFGGQVSYRDMYLSRPELFFEADLVIFVIDTLDYERYNEALDYLFKIVNKIKEIGEDIPYIVDLHKFDPDVEEHPELIKKRAELIDKIANKAMDLNLDLTFANSTIFLKESVKSLYSLAIKKMSAANFVLERMLMDYANIINSAAIMLSSQSGLVLGSYSIKPNYESILMHTTLTLETIIDYYQKNGLKKEESFSLTLEENNITMKTKLLTDINGESIYLSAIFLEAPAEFKEVEDFSNELIPIIKLI